MELRRQQFTFSPTGCMFEQENYEVSLEGVLGLELRITPSIGGGGIASLAEFTIR